MPVSPFRKSKSKKKAAVVAKEEASEKAPSTEPKAEEKGDDFLRLSSLTVGVSGMTCGSCVGTVTRAIESLGPDVEAAVSLASGTARVTGPPSITYDAVAAAIEACGFAAGPCGSGGASGGKCSAGGKCKWLAREICHALVARAFCSGRVLIGLELFLASKHVFHRHLRRQLPVRRHLPLCRLPRHLRQSGRWGLVPCQGQGNLHLR